MALFSCFSPEAAPSQTLPPPTFLPLPKLPPPAVLVWSPSAMCLEFHCCLRLGKIQIMISRTANISLRYFLPSSGGLVTPRASVLNTENTKKLRSRRCKIELVFLKRLSKKVWLFLQKGAVPCLSPDAIYCSLSFFASSQFSSSSSSSSSCTRNSSGGHLSSPLSTSPSVGSTTMEGRRSFSLQ